MTPNINVKAFKCNRCNHIWISRKYLEDGKSVPIACSRCKSAYWNRPITNPSDTTNKRKNKEDGKKDN